jgi:hypothetical protein
MQIIELELSHYDLYSPSTGELICSEEKGYNEDAKSLIGYWIGEVFTEPFIKDESLKAAWYQLIQKVDAAVEAGEDDEGLELENVPQFLAEYDAPSWIVFQLGHSDDVTGTVIDNSWFVLNMEK